MYYIYEVSGGMWEDKWTKTWFIQVPGHQSMTQLNTTILEHLKSKNPFSYEDGGHRVVLLGHIEGHVVFSGSAQVYKLTSDGLERQLTI